MEHQGKRPDQLETNHKIFGVSFILIIILAGIYLLYKGLVFLQVYLLTQCILVPYNSWDYGKTSIVIISCF